MGAVAYNANYGVPGPPGERGGLCSSQEHKTLRVEPGRACHEPSRLLIIYPAPLMVNNIHAQSGSSPMSALAGEDHLPNLRDSSAETPHVYMMIHRLEQRLCELAYAFVSKLSSAFRIRACMLDGRPVQTRGSQLQSAYGRSSSTVMQSEQWEPLMLLQ